MTNRRDGIELHALTPDGPRAVPVAAGATSLHAAMSALPDGVYSALRTFRGNRFLDLEPHLERTQRSMDGLGWEKTLDRRALSDALHAIVSARAGDSRVRFDVLPRAHAIDGVASDVFLGVAPHAELADEILRDGVRVDYAPHLARPRPKIKTTAFVKERGPLPIGTRERFDHLLVDAEGRLLEFSSANVAFVRGDELVTAGDGVLEGITIRAVLRLLPALGMRVRFARLHRSELASVDEALLTSSIRGPVPVVRVEDVPIGTGKVGPKARAIVAAYRDLAEREARPAVESKRATAS